MPPEPSGWESSSQDGVEFSDPVYVEGWPETDRYFNGSWHVQNLLTPATHAHKCLFAILYGFPISPTAICGGQGWSRDRYGRWSNEDLADIITICAYAEYYGCLSRVAPVVLDLLFSYPHVWKFVADQCESFILLAEKLRCPKLYFDAFRHLIVRSQRHPQWWTEVGEALSISADEALQSFKPKLAEQARTVQDLEDRLRALVLTEHNYYYSGPCKAPTTFLNVLSLKKKDRSDYAKARERQDFMARRIYGQWLTQQLFGSHIYESGRGQRPADLAGLNSACWQICEAAKSDDPSKLFGFKVASRMSSMFDLGRKFHSDKKLKQDLDNLVLVAADKVNSAFCSRITTYMQAGESCTQTYRRCEYDDYLDGFTFLPLDESKVPWDGEPDWPQPKQLPKYNTEQATDDQLKMLGFVKVNTAEKVDKEIPEGFEEAIDDSGPHAVEQATGSDEGLDSETCASNNADTAEKEG